MAWWGCEKPWLHIHSIQTCSFPPQSVTGISISIIQILQKVYSWIWLILAKAAVVLMGVCSAEFSLLANGNFILKFVFPDASQLFDAESLSQQEGPVLAANRPCPLLKTTSSFPHGRRHSSWCSAAAGPLVHPLQPSPPLWSAPVAGASSPCPLNPFSAYFAASLPSTNPSTNQDALPPSLENWKRREHVKDAGRASLFSFTCSPLPIEQTLLPLPFVPIYLPKYHSEIFLALYKSFMFYNLILHPGCKCYCCQSPRNTYK